MAKKKETTAVAKKESSALANPEVNQKGLSGYFAGKVGVTQEQFLNTIRATCFKGKTVTNEVMIMFLAVAKEYNLNPFTNEIYAFEKDGAVSIIVPIDGWLSYMNARPEHDGLECVANFDDEGELESCTTTIYRKDRSHPTVITERLAECFMPKSKAWQQWPERMLRHKSIIQCARVAYSLSNMYDPDEAGRIQNAEVISTGDQVKDATESKTDGLKERLKGAKSDESVAQFEEIETPDEARDESDQKPEDDEPEKKPTLSDAKNALISFVHDSKEAGLVTEAEYSEECKNADDPEHQTIEYMEEHLAGWKQIVKEKQSKDSQGEMEL